MDVYHKFLQGRTPDLLECVLQEASSGIVVYCRRCDTHDLPNGVLAVVASHH